MRDPHVAYLRYKIKTPENTTFNKNQVIKGIQNKFKFCLENGFLTCFMEDHFPSVKEARKAVEGFLRSWEIKAALEIGHKQIIFQFEDAKIIDRNPPPPGSPKIVSVTATISLESRVSVKVSVKNRRFPDPPVLFNATQDVKDLWGRYINYLEGKELLLSMAYNCLTSAESKAGGRKEAVNLFKIDFKILDTLGRLTAKGDAKTARKVPMKGKMVPLNDKEKKWIEEATKIIIRRTGELEDIQMVPFINMSDLPKL